MTKTKLISLIVIFVLWGYTPEASAAKLVPFREQSAAKPMPADVYPNISGNVNSSLSAMEIPGDSLAPENLPDEETTTSQQNVEKASSVKLAILIGIVLLLILILLTKKLRNRKI
jgi:hypothetical protein